MLIDQVFHLHSSIVAMAAANDVLAILQIGDGEAVVVLDERDQWRQPLPADPDLHGPITTSLCQPDPLRSLRQAGLDLAMQQGRTGVRLHRRLRRGPGRRGLDGGARWEMNCSSTRVCVASIGWPKCSRSGCKSPPRTAGTTRPWRCSHRGNADRSPAPSHRSPTTRSCPTARSTCLIAPTGAVEWMCVPRPDSPSMFAAMLDRAAGSFRLGPSASRCPPPAATCPAA